MPKLEVGVLVNLSKDVEGGFQKVADLGLRNCQLCSWEESLWTDAMRREILSVSRRLKIKITTFWAGYGGPRIWNLIDGPTTIGLVPRNFRCERSRTLKRAAEFAASLRVPSITTHVGFIPENPHNEDFAGVVRSIRGVARRCGDVGIEFWFESGQETPVTLLRTIERVGTDNLGINLDPANLIMYGRGNPVDALDVFGRYVRGVHAKDGLYPTDGEHLGEEVSLGKGKVDFPRLIKRLKALGYRGTLTIEREIGGPRQIADIKRAMAMLRKLS